jgi:hypothetical protein
MKNVLYFMVALLLVFWAIGFFTLQLNYSVHLLLVFAMGLTLVKLLQETKAN